MLKNTPLINLQYYKRRFMLATISADILLWKRDYISDPGERSMTFGKAFWH